MTWEPVRSPPSSEQYFCGVAGHNYRASLRLATIPDVNKPTRQRSRARTLAFTALYLVLALGFLEVSTRIALSASISLFVERVTPDGYRGELARVAHWDNAFGNDYKSDPLLRYYPTNGFFRDENSWKDFQRSDEDLVIMCLGSSTTFGAFVPSEKTYPALLEAKLRKAYPDSNIVVLNAGLPGANAKQSKRLYQFKLRHYEPDILIWRNSAELSDHFEVNVVESKLRYGVWYLLAHSKLAQLGILAASGGEVGKIYSDTFDAFYGVPDIHLTPEEVGYRSNFHMVQQFVEAHGGVAMALEYVSISDPRAEDPKLYTDADDYEGFGVEHVIRTRSQFADAIKRHGAPRVFLDGEHMSEIGTDIMAQQSLEYLVGSEVLEGSLTTRGRLVP